jgi:hypothetical protein
MEKEGNVQNINTIKSNVINSLFQYRDPKLVQWFLRTYLNSIHVSL